MIEWYLTEQS